MSFKLSHWLMDGVVADPSLANPFLADPSLAVTSLAGPSVAASGVVAIVVAVPPAPVFTLYLTEPGDSAAISVNDIHQGQIGDCFLLSPLGDMACYEPAAIAQMIHANANGTETVTLYGNQQGGVPGFGTTSFKAITETVTNVFPTNSVDNGASQDVVAGHKEIWPEVIEKAFAQANGGYAGIQNGGYPVVALQELTGHTASFESPSAATVVSLMKNIAAGDLVVMDTGSANAAFNLVGHHAYMFEGLQTANGVACVRLGNPWGFDAPSLIPVSLLSKGIVEVDIGHTH